MEKDPLEKAPERDEEFQMSQMKGIWQPKIDTSMENSNSGNSSNLYFRYFSPSNKQELSPEEKNAIIQKHKEEARGFLNDAEDVGASPGEFFACEVDQRLYTLDLSDLKDKYGYDSHGKNYSPQKVGGFSVTSFAKPFFTFRDVEWLINNHPEEQYKLYFSLNLDTKDKEKIAKDFAKEIIIACQKNRVSLMEKQWGDHAYDSMLLYTWDIDKLKNIVSNYYQKYKGTGIFLDTNHLFQGEIDGVSPDHIGWVQEPGLGLHSHSGRMGRLGKLLADGISYEDACNKLGILPEAPWCVSGDFIARKKKELKK